VADNTGEAVKVVCVFYPLGLAGVHQDRATCVGPGLIHGEYTGPLGNDGHALDAPLDDVADDVPDDEAEELLTHTSWNPKLGLAQAFGPAVHVTLIFADVVNVPSLMIPTLKNNGTVPLVGGGA